MSCVALEGSPVAVAWGREHLAIPIFIHRLEDSLPRDLGDGYDLVIYHDVYEHVPLAVNERVFKEVQRALRPGGYFWVITTCYYDWVETREPVHINNPTPTGLLRYGQARGFEGRILRPVFNLSMFTGVLNRAWKLRVRRWVKRYHKLISVACAPVWLPIWWLNARWLGWPWLDVVGQSSNVLFRKPL